MNDDRILEINSDDIRKLLAKLSALAQEDVITGVLIAGMTNMEDWTLKNRLSGPRPTVLDRVTSRLYYSVWQYPIVSHDGNEFSTSMGTNLPYGRIHEYGGWAGRNHASFIPARPYLRPSLNDKGNIDFIKIRFNEDATKAIEAAK